MFPVAMKTYGVSLLDPASALRALKPSVARLRLAKTPLMVIAVSFSKDAMGMLNGSLALGGKDAAEAGQVDELAAGFLTGVFHVTCKRMCSGRERLTIIHDNVWSSKFGLDLPEGCLDRRRLLHVRVYRDDVATQLCQARRLRGAPPAESDFVSLAEEVLRHGVADTRAAADYEEDFTGHFV